MTTTQVLDPSQPSNLTPRPPTATASAAPDSSINRRHAALIAGVGYVLLFGLAIFANFFVRESLVVADDPQATASNIAESGTLFRFGIVAFLAIFLIDIVVAWALHIVFRAQHHDLSLVAAWSRLVYTVFLGVAVVFLFQALAFYGATGISDAIGSTERNVHALIALDAFNTTWLVGLAAFGLHLIVLAILIARSAEAPRWLGVVMAIAGSAYIIDTIAHTVLPNYSDHADLFVVMVAVPSVIAEGWFALWLLTRARRGLAA